MDNLVIYSVAHSGKYHGVSTPAGISEFQVATVAGIRFSKVMESIGWKCITLAGSQDVVNQKANDLRGGDPNVFVLELHMNSSTEPHPMFGHMIEMHKGVQTEHIIAGSVDSMFRKVMPWTKLITIFEQPALDDPARAAADKFYPNHAFLCGHDPAYGFADKFPAAAAPAFLAEAGLVQDLNFCAFIDVPENQELLGWALASAIVGREISESEIND